MRPREQFYLILCVRALSLSLCVVDKPSTRKKGESHTQPSASRSAIIRALASPNAGRARRATVECRLLLRHVDVPALDLVGLGQGLPRLAEHLTLLRNSVLLASGLATTKKPSLAKRIRCRARVRVRGGMCAAQGDGQGQRVERAFHSDRLSAQNCMYGLFFFLPIADLGAISAQGSRSGGTQHRVQPRKDLGRGEGKKTVIARKKRRLMRECASKKLSRPARAGTGL